MILGTQIRVIEFCFGREDILMNKSLKLAVLSLTGGVLLAACGQAGTEANAGNDGDKLNITTTIYPVYAFTKEIVGDEADVSLMVPAGTEAHDFEPSVQQIAALNESDALVYHNENMETWVPSAQSSINDDVDVVKGTENMVLLPGSENDHDHDHDAGHEGHSHAYDPHTWVSPYRAIMEVESITAQLSELYPEMAEEFQANADAYIEELNELDHLYTEAFENASRQDFVTSHTAFTYLATDYGLNQIGIAGLTPEEEPSAARLAELADYVQENDIQYIYYEEAGSDSMAKTLADEAGVEMAVLNPLESLSQEAMDEGADYISVMKENLSALQQTTDLPATDTQETEEETEQTVYNGYFEDSEIADRALSDYAGEWQSVYPLLEDGTLDQVFDYKAKLNGDMTAEEYKVYYTTGYQTDVDNINITDNTIEYIVDGESKTFEYDYVGYEILTYEKGNRGVRFLYETDDPEAGEFKYVQFSDHNIAPVETGHYHIYWGGESQEALLEEMDHWPTYYPSDIAGFEIAQEMMAH